MNDILNQKKNMMQSGNVSRTLGIAKGKGRGRGIGVSRPRNPTPRMEEEKSNPKLSRYDEYR